MEFEARNQIRTDETNTNAQSAGDAFRWHLFHPQGPGCNEQPSCSDGRDTIDRANDVIVALAHPPRDDNKLFQRIAGDFQEELQMNGIRGAQLMADRVNSATDNQYDIGIGQVGTGPHCQKTVDITYKGTSTSLPIGW